MQGKSDNPTTHSHSSRNLAEPSLTHTAAEKPIFLNYNDESVDEAGETESGESSLSGALTQDVAVKPEKTTDLFVSQALLQPQSSLRERRTPPPATSAAEGSAHRPASSPALVAPTEQVDTGRVNARDRAQLATLDGLVAPGGSSSESQPRLPGLLLFNGPQAPTASDQKILKRSHSPEADGGTSNKRLQNEPTSILSDTVASADTADSASLGFLVHKDRLPNIEEPISQDMLADQAADSVAYLVDGEAIAAKAREAAAPFKPQPKKVPTGPNRIPTGPRRLQGTSSLQLVPLKVEQPPVSRLAATAGTLQQQAARPVNASVDGTQQQPSHPVNPVTPNARQSQERVAAAATNPIFSSRSRKLEKMYSATLNTITAQAIGGGSHGKMAGTPGWDLVKYHVEQAIYAALELRKGNKVISKASAESISDKVGKTDQSSQTPAATEHVGSTDRAASKPTRTVGTSGSYRSGTDGADYYRPGAAPTGSIDAYRPRVASRATGAHNPVASAQPARLSTALKVPTVASRAVSAPSSSYRYSSTYVLQPGTSSAYRTNSTVARSQYQQPGSDQYAHAQNVYAARRDSGYGYREDDHGHSREDSSRASRMEARRYLDYA